MITFLGLIGRNLRFHARVHIGVLAGAAVGTAILTGALLIGHSVRQSLKERALRNVGSIHYALSAADRVFQSNLAERFRSNGYASATAVLAMPATVTRQDASRRANRVNVLGVESSAWQNLAGWNTSWPSSADGTEQVFINEALASMLQAKEGDDIIARVRKPTALGLDAAIIPRDQDSVALRLKIAGILTDRHLGSFTLAARQIPPANLFIHLEALQQRLGTVGQANLLVIGPPTQKHTPADELDALNTALQMTWEPADASLSVHIINAPPGASNALLPAVELSTSRVFLDPAVIAAVPTNTASEISLLTYLANLIQAGTHATPYSMVAAADASLLPPDMKDGEIVVNDWLAEDLAVKPGDSLSLSYYVADSGSRLFERTNQFRVRSVVPLAGPYADRTLMPEFPGLAKAERTRDWDMGFPLDQKRIRDKDETYWKEHRGTPKAFVTLAAAQSMWANRFGSLTAIRYVPPPDTSLENLRTAVSKQLLANLTPAQLGLQFEAVRDRALKAAQQSQDFSGLFLGFSFFLIIAALLLMALLFQFGLEQRTHEIGTLLALGFTARQVRRMLLLEGAGLALVGSLPGVIGGILYARAMIAGLNTVWREAVGGSQLSFSLATIPTLTGLFSGILTAIPVLWFALRRQARKPAYELLAESAVAYEKPPRGWAVWVASASLLAAIGLIAWAILGGHRSDAGVFFGAGALLLMGGLALSAAWLGVLARRANPASLSFAGLAIRTAGRRWKRSLATVTLLALGCFLIVAIGAFRLDANQDSSRKSAGTGGFALIGESTLPVVRDLNTSEGRDAYTLRADDLKGVEIVSFRVRDGDEASCLNLNRAQRPRLLGVDPGHLNGRFTFASAEGHASAQGWELLRSRGSLGQDEVAAIGDANSIQWALGKKMGDTIDYVDERGNTFKLRLVGAVANSVLQGQLLIDEAEFAKRFPNESGYRFFLVDSSVETAAKVADTLSHALQDTGLELSSATARLNQFNAVQNTYLGTFQVLGGLGVLLGSAGVAIILLRNVLERRGELGLLSAVGFSRKSIFNMVLLEHAALLFMGLGVGVVSALVAILPAVISPGGGLPVASLSLTVIGVLLNAGLWTWLAARYATRGNLLEALRGE